MTISIKCPACGRELKLPDRRLLGRKGKCPKCAHAFVLQEEPAAELSAPAPVSEPEVMPTLIDRPPTPKEKPKEIPDFSFLANAGTTSHAENVVPSPSLPVTTALPDFGQILLPGETATSLLERQKKRKKSHRIGWIIGSVLGVVAIVVLVVAFQFAPKRVAPPTSATPSKVKPASKPTASPVQPKESPKKPVTVEADEDNTEVDPTQTPYAQIGVPTHGTPIEMFYIPFGTEVVINLHPAELWKDHAPDDEIRKCAPPLFEWGEAVIKQLFHCDPDEVDELLICLIPGTRGSLPEVAAVAHLIQDHVEEPFFVKDGVSIDTVEEDVYTLGQRAYLLIDEKTFATCPVAQMDEMIKAMREPHPAKQIDALLPMTDHERELTVIVAPRTLALNEAWFPEKLRPFVQSCVDWMSGDVEVFSWSLHFRADYFFSEILVRDRDGNARKLEKTLPKKLKGLSKLVQSAVDRMNPKDRGKRTLIERLPAMINVFSMATIVTREPHHLQLVTPLPDRAAPNLVLATYLAWEESTRTDFSNKPSAAEAKKLPPTVWERLKISIDVDFRASPMSESFVYIGGEIGTKFELDGDALKAGGFTKNLKQSFRKDQAPVFSVIQKMFEEAKGVDANPEKRLVIVIDEPRKQILVTTQAAAEMKGLTPTDLSAFR